jgi:hypothetical protein
LKPAAKTHYFGECHSINPIHRSLRLELGSVLRLRVVLPPPEVTSCLVESGRRWPTFCRSNNPSKWRPSGAHFHRTKLWISDKTKLCEEKLPKLEVAPTFRSHGEASGQNFPRRLAKMPQLGATYQLFRGSRLRDPTPHPGGRTIRSLLPVCGSVSNERQLRPPRRILRCLPSNQRPDAGLPPQTGSSPTPNNSK